MANTKNNNTFNLIGTIELLEERENGNGKYKLLQVCPSWCEKRISLFVTPTYKNGEENKVFTNVYSKSDIAYECEPLEPPKVKDEDIELFKSLANKAS